MLKKMVLFILVSLFLVTPVFATSYKVDPVHSMVGFTVDHLVFFKVSGYFTDFSGTIEADSATKTLSSTSATIKTASIDTRIEKRDNHLRSPDFFDAANHPEMTFVSKKVAGSGSDITVYGDLTIRGTTRPIVLKGMFQGENKDPWGNVRAGFAATGKINRKDFGLTWNKVLESGGLTVGEEVEISLQVEGVRN